MSAKRPPSDKALASQLSATSPAAPSGNVTDMTVPDQTATSDLLLRRRVKIVEDLWESVLRQDCGQELVDLLNQLRHLSSPEGQASLIESELLKVIEKLDLNEAIRAARAFALYFQLINIVEQHYEQRDQQEQYRTARDTAPLELAKNLAGNRGDLWQGEEGAGQTSSLEANLLEKSLQSPESSKNSNTFYSLFPKLRALNVPPRQIQQLISQLDVRLVFTAHPTEIVRHTIRDKQRRIAKVLRELDQVEDRLTALGVPAESWEARVLWSQLTEEIRLWWRTDELHQFKPTVLDEVDYTLHYFQEVLFDAIPQLYQRITQAMQASFPKMQPPDHNFCKFGSWVGSDRDGNPSVTPEVTWQTACYQRSLVLGKYIQSVRRLIDLLSLSLHWSDVLPDLLESLEQDQGQMPDIYESLAIRYRQEPYRLKLAYILKRLENTRDRNDKLYSSNFLDRDILNSHNPATAYLSGDDFLAELRLINRNLQETGLSCRDLDTLICQAEIYGFTLAHLDIRQESTRHSDTIGEIAEYLQVLPKPYNAMTEAERSLWLATELQTRRPLIPAELPFSEKTSEAIETLRTVRRMQQEFGPSICQTYVISMSHDASDLLEVLLLAKETGLYDPTTGISSACKPVPLFETVEDLQRRPRRSCTHLFEYSPLPYRCSRARPPCLPTRGPVAWQPPGRCPYKR
jgi:phosphoenolpyruvate carboxylase